MNKSLFYLLFAALVALSPVHAKPSRTASIVKASLNHRNISGTQKFASLSAPTLDTLMVNKSFAISSKNDYKDKAWFVYNIPICITGQERGKEGKKAAATLVDELKVKVYMIYTSKSLKSKDEKSSSSSSSSSGTSQIKGYRLVEKEITYVNIPMDKNPKKENGGGSEVGYVEMCVGIFIPQTVATQMTGEEDPNKATNNSDLTIVAFAIEPSFGGRACKRVDVPSVIIKGSSEKEKNDNAFSWALKSGIDPEVSKGLNSGTWWKGRVKEHFIPSEVEVMCISETPFAPYYASMYPATKPLYGSPAPEPAAGEEDGATPSSEPPLPGTTPVSELPSSSSSRRSTATED